MTAPGYIEGTSGAPQDCDNRGSCCSDAACGGLWRSNRLARNARDEELVNRNKQDESRVTSSARCILAEQKPAKDRWRGLSGSSFSSNQEAYRKRLLGNTWIRE